MQGVQGFASQLKLRFAPGLSALAPVSDDTFVALLAELFYSEGFNPTSRFAQTARTDAIRVGCVLTAEDGTSYRLIRDLKTGSAQLAKADGAQYAPIASGGKEVSQILRTQLFIPARDVFEALFVIDASAFAEPPSQPVSLAPVLMAQPLSLMMPESQAVRPAPEIHKELQSLRKMREASAGVEQLEYELDGLQKKRFQFDELAQKRQVIIERTHTLTRELERSAALDELPADFSALVENFGKQKQKFEGDRGKVLDELAKMDEIGAPPRPMPLFKDPKFLGGLGVGALILLSSAFLDGDLRLLGLLDIAPFGLAAVQALGAVNDLEASERYDMRLKALKERVKKIEARYERDTNVVVSAVKRFQVESADEVVAGFKRRAAQKEEAARMAQVLAEFDAGEGAALASDELAQLNARISEVETQLGAMATGRDPREIDRKIQALEAELSGAPAPSAPQPGTATKPREAGPSPFLPVLRALGDVSGADLAAVATQVSSRSAAYAGRLVSRPNTALTLDEQGSVTFGGVAYDALLHPEQHAVYLSVRLAAYELACTRHPFPLWIDRLSRVVDLPHDALPAFYVHLARRSQVFLLGDDVAVEQKVSLV